VTSKWGIISLISFTLLTLLIAYIIPSNSSLVMLRYMFGFIFVSFVPGYCLVQLLFSKEGKIDFIEKIVFSVALSFTITSLTGLFLGLTAIGINFITVTFSLTVVVLFLTLLMLIISRKR